MKTITNSKKKRTTGRRKWLCLFVLMWLISLVNAPMAMATITGSGTNTEPFLIKNINDWNDFKNQINGTGGYDKKNYQGKFWKLDATFPIYGSYIRVGDSGSPFNGTFDGGGNTLIVDADNAFFSKTSYVGVFGATENAVIKNFNISMGDLTVGSHSGFLIGEARGTLTIDNVRINNTGTTTITAQRWGGFVGKFDSVTNATISFSSVIANNVHIDMSDGDMEVGGFIGCVETANSVTITDCLANIQFTPSSANDKDGCKRVGGFIGFTKKSVTLIRCFTGCTIPRLGGTERAVYIGGIDNSGRCNLYSPRTSISTSNLVGSGPCTITDGIGYLPDWVNSVEVYVLDRRNNTGNPISSNTKGNEKWGYDTSSRPKLSNTGYAVQVISASGIGSITGYRYRSGSLSYYYTNADEPLTVTPSTAPTVHQRLEYTFAPAYSPSSGNPFIASRDGNNWKLTARVDGTVSAKFIKIPYPTDLKGVFNQWDNKITLTWTANNLGDLSGKWYIYSRQTPGTTSYTIVDSKSVDNTYSQEITGSGLETSWEYVVCFVEDGTTAPSEPIKDNSQTVTVSTKTSIAISSFTATGQDNFIQLAFTVPEELDNTTKYQYTISRKMNGGSYIPIASNQSFTSAGSYTYNDYDVTSSCDEYWYRLEIKAFGQTFSKETESGVSITGGSKIASVKATKGEYANYVRISWETSKLAKDVTERYKIFRRVVTNPDDVGIEIATINTADPNYIYTDNNIMPGVYYRYEVVLYKVCGNDITEANRIDDIGFSQSLGTVSGRITYGSGTAVKDVNVMVVRNDLQGNETQYHSQYATGDGGKFEWTLNSPDSIAYFEKIFKGDFTYQFWIRPLSTNSTGAIKFGQIDGVLPEMQLNKTDNRFYLSFSYYKTDNALAALSSSSKTIPADRFTHIALTRKGNTLKYYIINDENLSNITIDSVQVTNARTNFTSSTAGISMGYAFKGNIDEVRLWSKALTKEEIERDYGRMLTGNEADLKAYWTFDEGLDGYFFDISRVGTVFNGNHGTTSLKSGTDVPTREQLSLKAITDSDGNYQIRGIPFSGEGTSYDIVPSMGIHGFSPTRQLRYISNNSLVHNGTDFTDISSFPISGTIMYAHSNYPVDSVTIYVDGLIASKDGQPVMSNGSGKFTVDVPIGSHFITVVRGGHVFTAKGRFPANELEKYNFQTEIGGLEFTDETTVRLMGRVAGGQPETDKQLGFGLSKANIGKATITLKTTTTSYSLNDTTIPIKSENKIGGKPSTTTILPGVYGSTIEIETNPETGEFLAVLPPVPYNLVGVKTAGFEDTGMEGDPIDFAYSKQSFNMNPNQEQTVQYTDTSGIIYDFAYHDSVKITRFNDPVIYVTDLGNNVGAFGDKIYKYVDNVVKGNSQDILLYTQDVDSKILYALDYPVFSQSTFKYTWEINAYEEYVNKDNPGNIVTQSVPLEGKTIDINNGLASLTIEIDTITNNQTLTSSQGILTLDEKGKVKYTFQTGFPKLAGDNLLSVQIGLTQNGKTYYWQNPLDPAEDFKGYLLGMVPTDGNNFVTQGPDAVDIVLHDPPGSNSYAWIEKGSTISKESTNTFQFDTNEQMSAILHLAPKVVTNEGILFSVQTEVEGMADVTGGTTWSQSTLSGTKTLTTTTFNEQVSTSADPGYVGAMADVYIGKSTNLVFSKQRNLALYPSSEAPGNVTVETGGFKLFPKEVTAVGTDFSTAFTYTQNYIINTLIPNLKQLRNDKIKSVEVIPNSASLTFDKDKNPLYFTTKKIDDADFGNDRTYTVFFAPNAPTNKLIDEVADYNSWIWNWEQRIADNEEYKVALFDNRVNLDQKNLVRNRSFDGGVNVSESVTASYENTEYDLYTHSFGGSNEEAWGVKVNGLGADAHIAFSRNNIWVNDSVNVNANELTFGFELSEEGSYSYSAINPDAISLDIYNPIGAKVDSILTNNVIKNLHGYVFKRRAGQTTCPYEGEERSLYYKPGEYVLNEATFKVENPDLFINGAKSWTEANVPSGREASFSLELQNLSEVNLPVSYQLWVEDSTNPNGLILSIDGTPLTAPRNYLVQYGTPLFKTLKVKQSSMDVLDYENIVLVFGSACDETIYAEVSLNVNYIQSSSPVTLIASSKLVNRETLDEKGGKISFTISEYDRSFKNFGLIRMQYRKSTDQTWITLKEYVNDEALYPLTGDREKITDYTLHYDYTFGEIVPSDGNYIFRALAVSKIGYDEAISSSEEITIVKDVRAPQLLGNASPVNGILNAGDEISLTFNEDIQSGLLTDDKFTITGILNADIRMEPTVGLAFTGTERANTELPIYTGGSFSIETWFRRPGNTAGTLFAYGEGNGYISLGFNAAGYAVVTIGNETKTSKKFPIIPSEVWKYGGLSYNRNDNTVSVYVLEEGNTFNMFTDTVFSQQPSTEGKLYVGNNANGNSGFIGSVNSLHFYSTTRTSTEASASKSEVKSGSEPNLIGLWEMEEGEGTIAKDKSRSRHLLLNNSTWYIYPRGKSLAFNGTNDYATIPSGTFPFRTYDDFTWEFWFKGADQGVATLLSCGLTAYIGFDASHQLILTTANGNTYVLVKDNLLNDQWHHFALSVKRNGMLRTVIDGTVTTSINSSMFEGSVGGGLYYLGAKYTEPGAMIRQTSEYFKGNIDEFRVWGSALTTEAIALEKNHKLTGTEAGLKAYYPFESYQKHDQIIDVYGSLNDVVVPTDSVVLVNKVGKISDVAAPMMDARPVKNVPFTFAASERKIVLNITEEEYRIDNVSLKITADKVLDMNNNQSSTFTWIAYVNRNSVNWVTEPVDIMMQYGENKSFKATIQNSAGVPTDYYIENLPGWLTVSSASGTLQPLATKELTFTILKSINIGNYEASVILTGVNNVQKPLPVTLKVTGERPDWLVNISDFEQTMTVVGQVQIEGVPQEDEADILAAFIGEQCVGLVSPIYEASYNSYFVYMVIGGNSEDNNKNITFKLWDASSGNVYPVINLTEAGNPLALKFVGDDSYGTPDIPVYFNAQNIIEQSIALTTGWNWISFNVTNNNPVLLNQFKTNAAGYATQVKAGDGKVLNNNNNWIGTIASLDVDKMYVVMSNQVAKLRMIGTPVKPAETPITLDAGKWSWIGYTPQFSLSVSEALAGITSPVLNDQVKDKQYFRIMSSMGWIGSLNVMQPGGGYKYKSGNTQRVQFKYPSTIATLRSTSITSDENYMLSEKWNANGTQFSDNMTVTASIAIENHEITNGLFEIAAFCGNECRGSAVMQYIDGFAHPYMGFLMVYGENNDNIEFRIFDHETGLEYKASEKLPFSSDAIYGTPDELFILKAGTPTGIDTVEDSQIAVFPNPVAKELFIRHNLGTLDRVEIFDISGRLLLLKENFEDASINVSTLKEGTYFIHIVSGGQRFVNKFIKK